MIFFSGFFHACKGIEVSISQENITDPKLLDNSVHENLHNATSK